MPIEIRLGEDEVDAVMAFRALKQMHEEGTVPGGFDEVKVLSNLLRMVKGPNSAVLLAMDGEQLAGVLTLWQQDYWYSSADRHLIDKGFYVLPEHRNSDAARQLLRAAMQVSEDTRQPVYITIFNGRRKRGGRSEWERLGATLGYNPQGAVLAHFPGG